jgi:hypothetical protein
MNWKKYSPKLPVYVSAGILISGVLWYSRDDSHIRGEDIAAIKSAITERSAAFLTGPLTRSTTSEVEVVVCDDTSGGNIYWDGDNPLVFCQDDWDAWRLDCFVRSTANAPAGSYAEFGFLVDGERDSGRLRVAVGKDPPVGYKAPYASVLVLKDGRISYSESWIRLDGPGSSHQVPVKMSAPPARIVSGGPDRIDISPAIVKETALCELFRELRTLFQKSQSRAPSATETGIWWIKPDPEFDSKYASQSGGGFMTFDRPGYVGYATSYAGAYDWPFGGPIVHGFTCGVVWAESGYPDLGSVAPAVRTPKFYSLNSVYAPGPPEDYTVVIPGAFGWDPDPEELILPGFKPYVSLFVPLASSLPGCELVDVCRHHTTNAVDLAEIPWSSGAWNSGEYFDGASWNVLWAVPGFDWVEDETNAVEWTDFVLHPPADVFADGRGLTVTNVNARSVAGAMSRTIAVTPARVETNVTVRTVKQWEFYRQWVTHDVPGLSYDLVITDEAVCTAEVVTASMSGSLVPCLNADAFETSYNGPSYVVPPMEAFKYTWSDVSNRWELSDQYEYGSGSSTPVDHTGGTYGHSVTTVGLTNLYTEYPSEFALTNGMVSRVRVYAVFDVGKFPGEEGPPYTVYAAPYPSVESSLHGVTVDAVGSADLERGRIDGLPDMAETNEHTRSVTNLGYPFTKRGDAGDFTGLLGLATDLPGLAVPDYWDAPAGMTVDDSAGGRRLDYFAGNSAGPVKALRFTKVLDLSDPVSYPVRFSVNIGASVPDGQLLQFDDWDFTRTVDEEYLRRGFVLVENTYDMVTFAQTHGDFVTEELDAELKEFSRWLTMAGGMRVVVLVDWKFEHLVSPEFEPDPHTPEWLSINAP